MTIPLNEIPHILSWLAKERQKYDYWPKGYPVDRNNKPITYGWNNASFVNPSYNETIRKSQYILRIICNRMSNANTIEDKADAIMLLRFWKTSRRASRFAEYYCDNISDLIKIWEIARKISNQEASLKDLYVKEIGIAVASSLVTTISPTRSFGILDEVLGSAWNKNGWIKFDIRPQYQGLYLKPTPFNWNHYNEYVNDLTEICNAANNIGLTFIDPLTLNQMTFTVHDVEMAFFKHYYHQEKI